MEPAQPFRLAAWAWAAGPLPHSPFTSPPPLTLLLLRPSPLPVLPRSPFPPRALPFYILCPLSPPLSRVLFSVRRALRRVAGGDPTASVRAASTDYPWQDGPKHLAVGRCGVLQVVISVLDNIYKNYAVSVAVYLSAFVSVRTADSECCGCAGCCCCCGC